jgi:hypothetical protein
MLVIKKSVASDWWGVDGRCLAICAVQWYFSPVGSSTRGTTLKALRHALTSSFGTLCLASLVLTAVEVARSISERARRQRDNIVMCLVACVLECVYQLIEFISQ